MRSLLTLAFLSFVVIPVAAQRPAPGPAPLPSRPPAPPLDWRSGTFAADIVELTHEAMRDIDWHSMQTEALEATREAMRTIDWHSMQADALEATHEAMRAIDWHSMHTDALEATREAMRDIDWHSMHTGALEATHDAMRDIDWHSMRTDALETTREAMREIDLRGPRDPIGTGGSFLTTPPAPAGPQDAADSLYRVAREMLNRGEYRRAAEAFRALGERHPESRYAADARYWQAFALYRIGTVADMRVALAALEAQRATSPRASTHGSAATLRTRILGELASQGDSAALATVRRNAQRTGDSCDRDEMAVRVEALNALSRLDPAATTPALRRVLGQRDECSVSVRRRAVFLLGRQADAAAGDLLLDVIRNDPDLSVRSDAISMVARVPSDRSIMHLEEVARSGEARLASAALSALASTEHPRGRLVLRQIIERPDATESVRSDAIYAFRTDKATAEDIAFLRSVYPRLESRRLKERTIAVVARHPSPENLQWLMTLSGNQNEPVSIRATAVAQFGRAPTPITEVIRLYDSLAERQLKEHLVTTLAGRKEPEAVDKLIAIARTERDPQVRRAAIARLAQKNDPRTTQLLLEIIDQ